MRCAIFTATQNGIELAVKLKENLTDTVEIFVKEGRSTSIKARRYEKLSIAVKEAFFIYDALIFFMATGIVVRMIAPFLQNKLKDPAVIVVDEQGKYAISLLSGHVGGANSLTVQIAEILNSVPVITTATDVNKKPAPDLLSVTLGLYPYPKPQIQVINSALVEGKTIAYFIRKDMKRGEFYRNRLAEHGIFSHWGDKESVKEQKGLSVYITDENLPLQQNILYLRPQRLIAGVGCRRGTSKNIILDALNSACSAIEQDIFAISMLASTIVKSDEVGLLEVADELKIPIKFFSNEELQEKIDKYHLEESSFVKKQIGVGNVSAAAAMCPLENGRFALEKTKYEKVTVALVWEK